MGTVVKIKSGKFSCEKVRAFTNRLSEKLSFQNSDSLINTVINRRVGMIDLKNRPILLDLLGYGERLYAITGGVFNPTFRSPSDKRYFVMRDGRLYKHPDTIFDPGGFAKGFVIMKIYEHFFGNRRDGYINAGGDILVWGPDYHFIGYKDPTGKDQPGCIRVKGFKSIMSSGTYLRHEIMDPLTGRRINDERVSVVIGDNPTIADGLATAIVAEPNLVPELCKKFPTWSFYVETDTGVTRRCPNWSKYTSDQCEEFFQ